MYKRGLEKEIRRRIIYHKYYINLKNYIYLLWALIDIAVKSINELII